MLNAPEDVYIFNLMSYQRAATAKKCRHRKWYQWFLKPHYKNIKRLPRENPAVPCKSADNTEQIATSVVTPVDVLIGSHESIHGDSPTPVRQTQRKVRIDEVPYEIGRTSSESGNDSTLIETPSTVRAKDGSIDDERHPFENSHDGEDEIGDLTLLVPNFNLRNSGTSNRDSFISADDFQSVSSLISEDYAPSATTASMKSVYYSLPSETSSLIQIWQPEGEACS